MDEGKRPDSTDEATLVDSPGRSKRETVQAEARARSAQSSRQVGSKYVVRDLIGRGGMGEVLLDRHAPGSDRGHGPVRQCAREISTRRPADARDSGMALEAATAALAFGGRHALQIAASQSRVARYADRTSIPIAMIASPPASRPVSTAPPFSLIFENRSPAPIVSTT